ncbi:MAG TPA: DUF411 domain-containing protein [Methylophaga aminisulfidivorans]|uniref:DUF411 domain-containing protein n=1 Tax=Methylophaga aminisulfidivorans TaxID=230105 RepID=A0A7C1ZT34_9GAMM|nr:DUF411 domain-containing protein [Methylophaga aminisulfidivorans]
MLKLVLLLFCFFSAEVLADTQWDKSDVTFDDPITIKVYRDPHCQCCHKWIDHLKQQGFSVEDLLSNNVEVVKEQLGVPNALHSCHTAVVEGYVIEGHVPADDIKRLLLEKPAITGLAVPRMPVGTPGMEMGARKDEFAVITFDKDQAKNFDVFSGYQLDENHQYHLIHSAE